MKPKSLKENEEVIIIREEHDPYDTRPKELQKNYVAVFPDCEEGADSIMCLPMYIGSDDSIIFPEGHCTMTYGYYRSTKKVHNQKLNERLVKAVQDLWDSHPEPKTKLVLREKMYHGRGC